MGSFSQEIPALLSDIRSNETDLVRKIDVAEKEGLQPCFITDVFGKC